MTDDKIRDIFSRFQNLNLVFLIEDLKRGLVARSFWVAPREDHRAPTSTCPIAHGWSQARHDCRTMVVRLPYEDIGPGLEAVSLGTEFIIWWDEPDDHVARRSLLIHILKGILQERMDDADAVQAITAQEELAHV